MQAPAASSRIAASSAFVSPPPRTIGIWPMPFSTQPSGAAFHSVDLASAWICRRGSPATPMATGSQ